MKKINIILRKCKSLSKQLSSSSLGSKSARHHHIGSGSSIIWNTNAISDYYITSDDNDNDNDNGSEEEPEELVLVGSTRKRYVIRSKYLSHPIVNALMEKSRRANGEDDVVVINCEVVLFDHLLWMIENAEFSSGSESDSNLDELAELYCY